MGVGEVFQSGIPGADPIGAAAEAHDQFSVFPDKGFAGLICGWFLEGDFRLGVGCGNPFQNGALLRVIFGLLVLETMQKDRWLGHAFRPWRSTCTRPFRVGLVAGKPARWFIDGRGPMGRCLSLWDSIALFEPCDNCNYYIYLNIIYSFIALHYPIKMKEHFLQFDGYRPPI
jgi:hypothetical protein